jgi:5-methylcytosine-specific restriction endonuclease McrA
MTICKHIYCDNEFDFKSNKLFCSKSCKQKNKDRVSGRNSTKKRPYRIYVKDKCENCGFLPIHKCQLDVDHIDGNHNNNNPSNLQTLCANCHRLKTYVNRNWNYNI